MTTAADSLSLVIRLELRDWIEPVDVHFPGDIDADAAQLLAEELARRLEAIQPHITELARTLMRDQDHRKPTKAVKRRLETEYLSKVQDAITWLWWAVHGRGGHVAAEVRH